MSAKYCNIHDYLDMIRAKPPPIDEKAVELAKSTMIICDSIEEVPDILELLDAAEDIK